MSDRRSEKTTVLVVEEDSRLRETLSAAVDGPEVHVIRVRNATEAVNCVLAGPVDVLVAPLRGVARSPQLVRLARQHNDLAAVILTTEPNALDTDAAARLMLDGADDFLVKPIHADRLRAVVQRIRREQALVQENRALHRQLSDEAALLGFTGKSAAMRHVYDRLIQLASAPCTTVLISGESGTGKELAARALHLHGPRRSGPFVSFNCAAVPESLAESELFGHEQGSFTGASRRRRGRFEVANGGTLFFDEVAELSPTLQARLLRVLETREFERIGGETPVRVDVRIVAATNKDLAEAVQRGAFREDLYHRLRVATVRMPPLRERPEDISHLVRVFVEQFAAATTRPVRSVESQVLRLLERHPWPGNVRELKNCIEAMVAVSRREELGLEDLPDWIRRPELTQTDPADWFYEATFPSATTPTHPSPEETFGEKTRRERAPIPVYVGMALAEIEREAICATLDLTEGNKAEAARILGIARRTLFRKVKEFGR
jgi:two-component system response regulator HydG